MPHFKNSGHLNWKTTGLIGLLSLLLFIFPEKNVYGCNAPKVDFSVDNTLPCVGETVHFTDLSADPEATSWNWSFPGGTPDASTEQNPEIIYNTEGSYSVTLEAGNNERSNPLTRNDYIKVSGIHPNNVGISALDMSDLYPLGLVTPKATVKNFGTAPQSFDVILTIGDYTSTKSLVDIAPGAIEEVSFDDWDAAEGSYTAEVCTQLGEDAYTPNNCMSLDITVGYCPASTESEDEYIANVLCGNINNSSGWQGGVADFTHLSTNICAGQSEGITVFNGKASSSDKVTCWVDWDMSYTFDDDSEKYVLASNDGATTFTGTITVPAGTRGGDYRLRVRMSHNVDPLPCGEMDYGELEEYTIHVYNNFTPGEISSTGESICNDEIPSEIGSITAASGGEETITYSWRSSVDDYTEAIVGATSATYTPPAGLTTTTSYQRYANDEACNTTPEVSAGTWTITIYCAPPAATWTGDIDNDWSTAGNWDNGVPGSITDVIIPAGLNSYPTISSAAFCNTIILESGASLLGNGFLTVTGDATVEHEITGSSNDWHFLSSPIAAQVIEGDFTPAGSGNDYDFYAWDEDKGKWLNKKDPVNPTSLFATFNPGQGYLVAYEAPETKNFVGDLNTGNIVFSLNNTGTGDYKGSNLLGNPYPSFIDWTISTGFDQSKLVEDGGGYNIYIWDNDEAGNYGVYNSATGDYWGTNGASRYIPPMQGFFVIAETGGGEFIFNNEARVHKPQSSKKPGSGNSFRLSVTAPANAGKDEVLLDFGHKTSKGGADKWFSMSATAPSLFATTAERDYSIRFLTNVDDNQLIPVAFKAGVDGEYSIQANFSTAAFSVKLMDQLTGNVQDLNKNPFYSFTATTGDDVNRFNLVFGTLGIDNPESAEAIQVYAYGDVLYLATSSKEAAVVSVYNLTGQLVMQSKTNGSDLSTFNASALSDGIYVVNVIFNQGVVSQKVVIRR